jgi:hypothetical protein
MLPADDQAVRASVGSVGCAVHAKAKTALEVAEEIARAASARLPGDPSDLAPAVRDALGRRGGRRFNVIIDALDEAASPAQARVIIDKVVLALAETCSDAGAQVVVGTRRRDNGGDLLGRFGGALASLDLDEPEYFSEEDLAAYALACLQLAGDTRPGNTLPATCCARCPGTPPRPGWPMTCCAMTRTCCTPICGGCSRPPTGPAPHKAGAGPSCCG